MQILQRNLPRAIEDSNTIGAVHVQTRVDWGRL